VGNTSIQQSPSRPVPVHPHTRGEHARNAVVQLPGIRFIPTHVGNTDVKVLVSLPVTVHPHTRGEHASPSHGGFASGGSSPHTWGTPELTEALWIFRRFIPTHVGNTFTKKFLNFIETVHPHTRGEHTSTQTICPTAHGSSPHTWGTHQRVPVQFPYVRFIPTHVGNTIHSSP